MRHRYLLYLLAFVFIACKKEPAPVSDPLAAITQTDQAYGSSPAQKMDLYLPSGRSSANTPVLILIHGGAWFGGDKSDFGSFIDSLKKRLPAYAIFNINYRLSSYPNNLFPTQEMDVKSAVEYIYSKRNDYQISDRWVMMGVSAGAHLALLHGYKNTVPVKVKAIVDFFGPTDLNDLYNNPGSVPQFTIERIIGATPTSNPTLYQQSSPVNWVSATVSPTILLQGGNDPLVHPQRQAAALRDRLIAAGVPTQWVFYPDKGHGDDWDSNTYFDAFNQISSFLQTHNP